ncbi:hypothetical protein V6N11_020089 [Hibiscus sabdariffa]|uniref:Uncharacterized protein n=1 Tax=Hibiscus sabdariffa TaxID=183260 RepID=A0ABR2P8K5_9ROSI
METDNDDTRAVSRYDRDLRLTLDISESESPEKEMAEDHNAEYDGADLEDSFSGVVREIVKMNVEASEDVNWDNLSENDSEVNVGTTSAHSTPDEDNVSSPVLLSSGSKRDDRHEDILPL